jgi:hypothetical protein
VSVWGARAGGFVGTLVLTITLAGANQLRLTRMDIPFLLGTAWTEDRSRARVVGYALHFVFGLLFSLAYYAAFLALGRSGWALGALFGLLHALFAGTTLVNLLLPSVHPRMGTSMSAADSAPLLESPGFLLLNYGRATPTVTILAHLAYGAIVGVFARGGPG